MLQQEIEKHILKLKRLAGRKDVRTKISRLAWLNVRSLGFLPCDGPLTPEEEVEREFLDMTLPHACNRLEFDRLLKLLENCAKDSGG